MLRYRVALLDQEEWEYFWMNKDKTVEGDETVVKKEKKNDFVLHTTEQEQTSSLWVPLKAFSHFLHCVPRPL